MNRGPGASGTLFKGNPRKSGRFFSFHRAPSIGPGDPVSGSGENGFPGEPGPRPHIGNLKFSRHLSDLRAHLVRFPKEAARRLVPEGPRHTPEEGVGNPPASPRRDGLKGGKGSKRLPVH